MSPSAGGFAIENHRTLALLALASLVLMSLIFAPLRLWPPSGWWPLSFVCLVPWLIMIGGASRAPRVYFYSYVFGLAFFILNMRWLYAATGPGYAALSVYLAAYFPAAACPLRHAIRRRRIPLAIALPLIWTGTEMLRAVVISGFPWFYLSHSLSGVLPLIQVSDLVGAYGVTFMVAAVNGAIGDVVLARLCRGSEESTRVGFGKPRLSVAFAAVLVVASIVYGQLALHRSTGSTGPRVAIIQGDFLNSVFVAELKDHDRASNSEKMEVFFSMMDDAAKHKPDVVVLPETPWVMSLNADVRDFSPISRESFARFQEYSTRHNAVVVTGSQSRELTPFDMVEKARSYNSATVFKPEGSEPGRYDKVHLVYFGETVPFRYGRLRFLYSWLNELMPFSDGGKYEYSLFRGKEFKAFSMDAPSQGGLTCRFGIPICYEDVMPYVSREFVCNGPPSKRVDFLLNISNDGWFGRGIQQPQHLAICVYRAVENRVGIARAVNTGVSAFIEPSGRVHGVVNADPSNPWPGLCGYSVAELGIDSRLTFYSLYGDWFAWACSLMWLILFVDYWIVRVRTRAAAEREETG